MKKAKVYKNEKELVKDLSCNELEFEKREFAKQGKKDLKKTAREEEEDKECPIAD